MCLKGGVKATEPGSSQWCPVTGREAMGTNKHRKFHLNIRKIHFYYEGDQTLEEVVFDSTEIVESPSLEIFRTQLDVALRNLFSLTLL